MDILLCRTCNISISTVACNRCLIIIRMDSFLHDFHLFFVFCELLNPASTPSHFWPMMLKCYHNKLSQTTPASPCSYVANQIISQRKNDSTNFGTMQLFYRGFYASFILPTKRGASKNICHFYIFILSVSGNTICNTP